MGVFRFHLIPDLITKLKIGVDKIYHGVVCILTPRCHEMTHLISEENEKSHSWLTRLRMRRHLGVCIWCQRYQDQIGLIGKLCRMFAEESPTQGEIQLSDEAKARLKEALKTHSHE